MFNFSLNELTAISLLRSDRWLDFYCKSFDDRSDVDRLALQAVWDYQYYSEVLFRREDIQSCLTNCCDVESREQIIFRHLQRLSEQYLRWRGDHFCIKSNMENKWAKLISKVDPAWLLAAGYAEKIGKNELTIGQMYQCSERQCRFASSQEESRQVFADNHVHLAGHGDTSLAMFDFATQWKPAKLKSERWPHLPECTLYESGARPKEELPILLRFFCHYLQSALFSLEVPSWYLGELALLPKISNTVNVLISQKKAAGAAQLLVKESICSNRSANARWLLLLTGLYSFAKYDPAFIQGSNRSLSAFGGFLHCSNIFRSAMIVGGVGLGRFVEYFSFPKRKGTPNSKYNNHSLAFDNSSEIYREFKIHPSKVSPKWLKTEATRLLRADRVGRVHYAIHFSRSYDRKEINAKGMETLRKDRLKKVMRTQLRHDVAKLKNTFSSIGLQRDVLAVGSREVDVNLLTLVRGIDVAGNENDISIEFFAPALRQLRCGSAKAFSDYFNPMREMHYTIHAGEDFSHLSSGLRAIDETVRFCSFEEGDRLGHALALGVDVQQWMERQQAFYLSAQEHLDNLMWCYSYALRVGSFLSCSALVIKVLESKIDKWSRYIYEKSYSAGELFDAWMLRRNCPLAANLRIKAKGDSDQELLAPDFSSSKSVKAEELWFRYVYSASDPAMSERMAKIINVTMEKNLPLEDDFSETMSVQEVELLAVIQDYLIQKYSEKGIVIEACPTSNIYIGRFNAYHEHPIFRWYPPKQEMLSVGGRFNRYGIRTGPISVCVNTDDSGLMPTTIKNEHRLLKQAAVENYGLSSEDARLWSERLRQIGVENFERNHVELVRKKGDNELWN